MRKVFLYYSSTDIWTSWAHTDLYCKFAFTFCVNRTGDIPTGGSLGATFVYVGLQVAVPGISFFFSEVLSTCHMIFQTSSFSFLHSFEQVEIPRKYG